MFLLLFIHGKSHVLILTQKMEWAPVWAIFSQAHPVTLIRDVTTCKTLATTKRDGWEGRQKCFVWF
jgi:hypothetical protein